MKKLTREVIGQIFYHLDAPPDTFIRRQTLYNDDNREKLATHAINNKPDNDNDHHHHHPQHRGHGSWKEGLNIQVFMTATIFVVTTILAN